MFTSYKKGQVASLKVQLRANERGFIVSIPTVESRYDLVFDDGQKMYRVQVKYCDSRQNKSTGSVELDLRKQCRGRGNRRSYSKEEIDVVIAYLPATDKCYWCDAAVFDGAKSITLRFEAPKRKQKKRIRYAKDFEF